MPYVAGKGDRPGLVALAAGGVFAAGATALALRHPALQEPAHWDAPNVGFVLLGWLALAGIGNALWIMIVEDTTFPRRWWFATALFVGALVAAAAWGSWPIPIAVLAVGAFIGLLFEILNLLEIPFMIAWLFVDTRNYPNSESFRLVKPRRSRY